jgi:hypothetical protein
MLHKQFGSWGKLNIKVVANKFRLLGYRFSSFERCGSKSQKKMAGALLQPQPAI